MKRKGYIVTIAALLLSAAVSSYGDAMHREGSRKSSLKQIVKKDFMVGVALNTDQVNGADPKATAVITRHFNTIVAENCMKSEVIHPEEGVYNFTDADAFVDFGTKHKMFVVGHCLIWHSQLAKWFAVDGNGRDVSPEVLKQRMKEHITTIVTRYKGRIKGWDVVNEAILDDGTYRQSPFYRILGEEFIPLAFQYAHEADPKAELYYNDYGMQSEAKRRKVAEIVSRMRRDGLRVDAIGMQGHMGMDYPDLREFEKSIEAFAATGAKVMITEWDMSALPTVNTGANVADTVAYNRLLNPYPNGLPEDVDAAWNERMTEFFNLFRKHADVITRVNAWGVTDGDSWKNYWPMKGRVEYPLLFDRNYQPKQFLKDMGVEN
jgi:endo-1,4-beta-xylanase